MSADAVDESGREALETVRVELPERGYDILIGAGLRLRLAEFIHARLQPSQLVVVADETVMALHGRKVVAGLRAAGCETTLLGFPEGEASKCLQRVEELCDDLLALKLDRQGCLVALGGGVTGDLVGFTAAVYQRGIDFIQVPTTLLAQVDSSVGGKTGVNHPRGKNMIGAFHQPRLVVIDPEVLSSLHPEELSAGLAEVVKHGMVRDAAYFDFVDGTTARIRALESEVIRKVVADSCRIKADVVAADEREGGLRAILNFGHTFAHAYETLSGYRIAHGQAVAMGMMAACRLSELYQGLEPEVRQRLRSVLTRLGLPVRAPALAPEAVIDCIRRDKKNARGKLRFVLPTWLGNVRFVEIDDLPVVRRAIEDAARA